MSDTPAPVAPEVETEACRLWTLLQQQVREDSRVAWRDAPSDVRAECYRVVKAHTAG